MSVGEPSGSSMKLPLHHAGDHNGNAFPVSSSSSSSLSSCLGASSPESLRSLSSLSGGRTDSPLDYEVLEVTLTTTVMTKEDAVTGVVLSRWPPEDEQQRGNNEEEEVSAGRDLSESNETSLSVYLDADGSGDRQESWNDNRTLSLSLKSSDGSHGNSCDLSSGSSVGRRRGSFDPDSDATEVPADDDDDDEEEEEALFLSVSSDMYVTLTQEIPAGSPERHPEGPLLGDQDSRQTSHGGPEDLSSQTSVSSASCNGPAEDAPTVAPLPPEEPGSCPAAPEAPQTDSTSKPKQPGADAPASPAVKLSSVEAKRVSRPYMKSDRAKEGSRCNTYAPKVPPKTRPTPAAVIRKGRGDGGPGSSPGPIKVAVILRPVRGKSRTLKNNHKMAATTKPAQLKRVVALSRALSDSSSSLGSEGVGGAAESPRRQGGGEANPETPRSPWRVSSRLGPGAPRPPARGAAAPPGSGTGPPGLQQAQTDGGQSPSKARPSLGIPKPRTNAERASALAQSPAASSSKPAANQQPAAGSAGRPAAPTASKLPVKGLTSSSSQPGSGENDAAASKGPPAPPGTQTDERSSRSTLPAGSQSPMKAPGCSAAAAGDAVCSAAVKPPAGRGRAPSLQARTCTGLKAPTNHNTAKAVGASQTAAKASPTGSQVPTKQAALQRSGSARLARLNGSVDKNKPREAPTRAANPGSIGSSTQVTAAGNQQLPPPELVPDVVNGNTAAVPVLPAPASDATKARTGPRANPKTGSRLQSASRPGGAPVPTAAEGTAKRNQNKEQAERRNQAISQLRRLLVQGNRRVEALATVIQHLFTAREDALRQKKELSLQLEKLRDELVSSAQGCERLQKEKEAARLGSEEALRRLEEQHREDLVQLEDRLRSFYQTEWDKVHQVYQEEADKCRLLMEQQVEELRSRQEVERKNQEVSHSQEVESVRQQYQASIEELKEVQKTELEGLQKTLKETETSLSEQISELSAEKDDLSEKLRAEEERRKQILGDKTLKDSHTVYLERELESLKVVLEMKNNQLHQKDKKLVEMDKLVETNVKLEECLKKVTQENEDYRARMDKHAALSRQLSTEQAILQQTLQKESKVNKRLSMENEELLWKLHNGDLLASPRRPSPTSPFGSPRNSASFPTAAPLSPR
ncbi:microtubule-associated tumor suppressor 1 homolog isoform X2 [Cololabis saira]|uniref:microtubule-associated tumor suppressor 1 homolog isoform X2 n=1 Tax=Cololabis saira TaxID=129043 RepID=UPI002AD40A6A|nr:microtubule-associated tumor suppressor 1 homolog isoform X2 [Cololabis saira]